MAREPHSQVLAAMECSVGGSTLCDGSLRWDNFAVGADLFAIHTGRSSCHRGESLGQSIAKDG